MHINRSGYQCGETEDTLRGLLAFAMEPAPSDEQIEQVLSKLTVAQTIRQCIPQFWTMSMIMHELLKQPEASILDVEIKNPLGLIGIATRAFLDGNVTASTLWAVTKLHTVIVPEQFELTNQESRLIYEALPWDRMGNPVYRWQGKNPCVDEEWTNCLGVADTRRFIAFVLRAYRENWSGIPLVSGSDKKSPGRAKSGAKPAPNRIDEQRTCFKDNPDYVAFAEVVSELHRFRRPFVSRMWD